LRRVNVLVSFSFDPLCSITQTVFHPARYDEATPL
jgi:hypothetical protein